MAKNNRETDCEIQHVLQICHTSEPPFLDCARQYAALFEQTEYTVITIFLSGSKPDQMDVRLPGTKAIFLNCQSAGLKGLKVGLVKKIRKIACPLNVKLIIAHRYKSTYIALRIGDAPVVAVNHAFGVYRRWARRVMASGHRERLLLIGVSYAVKNDLRACLPKFPEDGIECLYNRIDRRALAEIQLNKQEARKTLGLDLEGYIYGNVGRLHPDKDQLTLISSFAKIAENIPEAYLVIIGEGRERERLMAHVKDLGVGAKVRFLGQVTDAARYFRAFDCFVLSSDDEPFGMVLLEAMTANIPVVCTASGGGAEVVGDTEALFPKGDSDSLARLMSKLYEGRSYCCGKDAEYNARIEDLFSDNSATHQFWNFPTIKKWLS